MMVQYSCSELGLSEVTFTNGFHQIKHYLDTRNGCWNLLLMFTSNHLDGWWENKRTNILLDGGEILNCDIPGCIDINSCNYNEEAD